MTVQELIEKLQKIEDKELPVWTYSQGCDERIVKVKIWEALDGEKRVYLERD